MNKQEFLKSQTCVLRVNIHCDGCKQKVRKLLQKIDGVYTVSIDAEQGKVTVSGNINPDMLIKKLVKSGKHAELWAGQKGSNNNQNQFKNMQFLENFGNKSNGKDGNKSQNGGGKDNSSKNNQIQQIMQQMKGANNKDHGNKANSKGQKSKFTIPTGEFDEFGEFDSDSDDFDSNEDEFDDDEEEEEMIPTKGNKSNGLKGSIGNFKKSSGMDVLKQLKGIGGKNDAKNDNGGKKGAGDNKKDGKNGQGDKKDGKNGQGDKKDGKNDKKDGKNDKKDGKNGGGGPINKGHVGGGNNNGKDNKKGGKNDGFKEIGLNNHAKGAMGNYPLGHMGNFQAGHGPPPATGMNGGYYQGMGPGMGQGNPYMAAMMMNQQQNGHGGMNHPMMYAPPHAAVSYGPPMAPPVAVNHYTHMFSDENTSSCNIM